MLISEIIGSNHERFLELKILDTFTDIDANYYINIGALKATNSLYFKDSYKRVSMRFEEIFKLLLIYNKTNDSEYFNQALEKFYFPEVNELGIGLAQSVYGKGLTSVSVRKSFLLKVAKFIKDSKYDPNIFMLVSIFSKGVGADLISDMIANIIKDDIVAYTKAMNKELIGKETLVRNEAKGLDIYYLPMELVDEIPLPKSFLDIDTLVSTNINIREQLNDFIKGDYSKLIAEEKTRKFNEFLETGGIDVLLFEIGRAIDHHDVYDFGKDPVGILRAIEYFYGIEKKRLTNNTTAMSTALELIDGYVDTVKNNCPFDLFLNKKGCVSEKKCQTFFHIYSKRTLQELDYDFNRESNQGNGCLDFKLSKGANDKVLIEMKLLSNNQYLHGLEKQLLAYSRADFCKNLIYLVIEDNKFSEKVYSSRMNEINDMCFKLKNKGYNVEIKYMKLEEKKSASKE